MSVLMSMSLQIKPENVDALLAWFKKETKHTVAFEGCEGITVYQDKEDPCRLLVFGTWRTRADHENYLAWRMSLGHVETIMGWLAEEPGAGYYDALDMT